MLAERERDEQLIIKTISKKKKEERLHSLTIEMRCVTPPD
jgi:hypothetical protein